MDESISIIKKRLLYRSLHRGCKETDIILGEFALHNVNSLTGRELALYEKIVDCDDLELYSYITENLTIPEELDKNLIHRIISFNQSKFHKILT